MASLSFRELVRGLVAEHERELTDLRLEIKHLNGLLGEQSAGTKSNGHARCTGPKDDETVRPGNDEDVQDNDLSALDPELPRAMGSFIRVDTADVDVAAASVGLALDENLPERESFARAVTQKIARWTATVPGFRADQVTPLLHGLHWWMSLKEPPRTGLMASIVNSRLFTLLCYVVIALNAILIVHSSNAEMERALHNDVADYTEETRSYFIANCVFIGFYTAELLLKFYVHRIFMFANDDYRWNLFDVGLVGFGAIDLLYASSDRGVAVNWSFLRLLRIVRVVKVFRALKAMESVHDVSLMVECVTNTTSTLFWCLVLMMFVVAIFGLIFVQALAEFVAEQQDSLDLDLRDDIREHFGSVRIAMTSLFEATTGGVDWHDQYALCGNVGFALQLVYLFFQAFFVIVAWNVVTSMFVEKAFRLAVPDAEQLIQEKEHRDARYACEMMRLLHDSMDVDHNDRITLDEFKQRANHPSFRNFLEVRGVDFKNPKAFFEMLRSISGNDWVDCKTFVACCLQLQGAATNIDLQSLHYEIRKTLIQQGERLSGVEELIRKQSVAFVRHENSDGGSSTGNGTVCTI